MNAEEKLMRFYDVAVQNEALRIALLNTWNSAEPLRDFCKIANQNGCDITLWELADGGREFCDAMLRSVNGGGVEDPNGGWDDLYAEFLQMIKGEIH